MGDFRAQWRIAAADVVPYSKDYSEWMTMSVELLNGQKNADNVCLEFVLSPNKLSFTYTDDGDGCTHEQAQARLLSWASKSSANGDSIYGHGTKKFLAKSGDYDMPFSIRSRPNGAKSKAILEWTGPYLGLKTKHELLDVVPDFPEHGFQIHIPSMDRGKLGAHSAAKDLRVAIQEIIRVRKSQSILNRITYTVKIREEDEDGEVIHDSTDKSDEWISYFEYLYKSEAVIKIEPKTVEMVPGKVTLQFHTMFVPKPTEDKAFHTKMLAVFPTYGNFSGGNAARVHCSNNGTMIEALPFTEFYERATHSSMYHTVQFAFFNTMGGKDDHKHLPQPGTTKVQYRYETPIWKDFVRMARDFPKAKPVPAAEPAPAAEPLPAPAPAVPEPIIAGPFTSHVLMQRKKRADDEGSTTNKYSPPAWIQFSEVLVVQTGDDVAMETFKERQKGDLKDDVYKAYTVLSCYANEKSILAENLTFTLMFKGLKNKSESKKRSTEFTEILDEMNAVVYPYKGCLKFKMMEA
jgi:hypothetical protein